MSNPLEGKGVVLIDEIELHMHPSWQRVVLRTLKKTFPNIQFIITTHSPQVLSELDDSYAIFSLSSDTEDGNLTTPVRRMDGCDSNYILEEYMQTSSKNVSYAELVNNAYHAIYRNEFTMAERYIDRVRQISGDNSIDMIHLEAALMRGKILYEKNHKGQHS